MFLDIEVIFNLLAFIVESKGTHLMLVMCETLAFQKGIMCGLKRVLTTKDPKQFGYLTKLNFVL